MLKLATRDETHPVIRWLMTDARRRTDANEFLEAFALELRAAGVDVSRITTGVPILHPQIFSFSGLWQLGKGTSERLYRTEPGIAATLSNSPIGIAYQGGGPVRCNLSAPPQDGEFAVLSDLRRDGFIDLLICYVGPMCDEVAAEGGEILKFIGDAMLAIFPIGADAAATCRAALGAAERAQVALAEENRRREGLNLPRIEYGLALHVGDVIYGNIGSDTRLDFTVIGPAVNLTARIESMCRQLGPPLFLSSDFVKAGPIAAQSLAAFSLK